MAVITPTLMTGSGQKVVTVTTLGASDTFVYRKGPAINATLVLNNVSGGALTPLILGVDTTTYPKQGLNGSEDVSPGVTLISIGAGAVVNLKLDTIEGFLSGASSITLTGGDAIEASLIEQA